MRNSPVVTHGSLDGPWDCSTASASSITGVLTDASLAFGVAELAQEQGAEIILTGAGPRPVAHRSAPPASCPSTPRCSSSTSPTPTTSPPCATTLGERWGRVDGALHAIGFAPRSCLGGDFLDAPWDDVAVAMHVSAYSLKTLADVVVPLMTDGGSIVGLDFDDTVRPGRPTTGWAWPRPPSSRPPATSPATSGPRASG